MMMKSKSALKYLHKRLPAQTHFLRRTSTAILSVHLCANGMTAFVPRATNWRRVTGSTPEAGACSQPRTGEPTTKSTSAALLFLALAVVAPVLVAQGSPRTVHVFVALADNKNQGIVPVAAILGNGDDPAHNLYWGSAYGYKTFFSRNADWQLAACQQKPRQGILERCVFKHRQQNVYLVVDRLVATPDQNIFRARNSFTTAAASFFSPSTA
jgi:hypothetical protein